jgi:hypothetical protein
MISGEWLRAITHNALSCGSQYGIDAYHESDDFLFSRTAGKSEKQMNLLGDGGAPCINRLR